MFDHQLNRILEIPTYLQSMSEEQLYMQQNTELKQHYSLNNIEEDTLYFHKARGFRKFEQKSTAKHEWSKSSTKKILLASLF